MRLKASDASFHDTLIRKDSLEVLSFFFLRPDHHSAVLTEHGFRCCNTLFKFFEINIGVVKPIHQIYLDTINYLPYYIEGHYLLTCDGELNTFLTLTNGDLDSLIRSSYRLDNDQYDFFLNVIENS